ncbi:ogt, partial [Symbiodinium pilosum]
VCLIPQGRVSSYVEVSRVLGQGWSPRSVGQALKRNPHAPVVPCHRIVRADRSLGGYFGATCLEDGQMQAKVRLLEEEGVVMERKQDSLFVKPECFWHFPQTIELEAVILPPV